jgi:hypothetical protein
MSYARWSEGDVYVFADASGGITCMSCKLMPEDDGWHEDFRCSVPEEMFFHLQGHKNVGHSVPDSAMERLETESRKEGGMIKMEVKL